MQYFGLRVITRRIGAIKSMMKDKSVPKRKKAVIIAGIIYLCLPIDFIPIALLPIAWVDDVLIWLGILWYLRHELDKYWIGGKPVDFSKKFRGKNVVDDVKYEVKDDKDDNKK